MGTAFCLGVEDRHTNRPLRVEQLYRSPWTNRLAWRLGWELANMLTQRPLRTAKRPPSPETSQAKETP